MHVSSRRQEKTRLRAERDDLAYRVSKQKKAIENLRKSYENSYNALCSLAERGE